MKLAFLFLATLAAAAPPARKLVVKSSHFSDRYKIYTSSHDIVDIAAPHLLDEHRKLDLQYVVEHATIIFFVEADVKDKVKHYKGLYVNKDNETKIALENGQSVTYGKDFNVYFGASDGIYKYDEKDNTAEKVGTVTDSVVTITYDTKSKFIYYLTADHVLYKIDEIDYESTKIEAVKDARDITFDARGNMFFYNGDNQFYVYNGENVLKIEGIPSDAKEIGFIKNPFIVTEVFAIVDRIMYKVTEDGTSEKTVVEFEAWPTAFSLDYAICQYYAFNKTLYRFTLTLFDLIGFAGTQQ